MRKWLTAVTLFMAAFLFIWFISIQNWKEENEREEGQIIEEIPEAETDAEGKAEQGEELSDENDLEEFWLKEEKIELADFAELPIEEFIKETEIPLYQEDEGKWRTEDNLIWAKTDNGKIISFLLCDYTGDAAKDEKLEQLIETKGFPYTIAGINLHDNVKDGDYLKAKNPDAVYTEVEQIFAVYSGKGNATGNRIRACEEEAMYLYGIYQRSGMEKEDLNDEEII